MAQARERDGRFGTPQVNRVMNVTTLPVGLPSPGGLMCSKHRRPVPCPECIAEKED